MQQGVFLRRDLKLISEIELIDKLEKKPRDAKPEGVILRSNQHSNQEQWINTSSLRIIKVDFCFIKCANFWNQISVTIINQRIS